MATITDTIMDAPRPAADAVAPTLRPNGHRLRSIDSIRGLAAFLVVIGHSFEGTLPFMAAGPVRDVLTGVLIESVNLGRVGVVAFFILSGYVIPFSFGRTGSVRSFVISRLFRLYPAYWVSIAVAVATGAFITGQVVPPGRVAANLTMIQMLLGARNIIGVYWTLLYELIFYAMCVAAFSLKVLTKPRYLMAMTIVMLAIGVVAAILRGTGLSTGVPIGPPLFLAIMHLGAIARLADRGDTPGAATCYKAAMLAVLLTAGPISAFGFIPHVANERMIAEAVSVYVGLGLFMGLRGSQAICRPSLLFLGLISYSLYLFHPPVIDAVSVIADGAIARPYVPLAIMAVVPPLAILVAAVVQRTVEAPFNRLGKSLQRQQQRTLPG